ncbi:MAG: HD-GYP domain-containing protein [Tissierellia bacterium]|nr:HD-GYP domain-containing protein [Tissierellia bacterium]
MPNNSVGVSVGYATNLAAIIVGGPLLGTTVSFLGFLLRVPKIQDRGYVHLFNTPVYKTIFNVSQNIIVTSSMGLLYIGTGGKIGELYLLQTILILIIGAILNTIIISKLMSILSEQAFIKVWVSNIRGTFASALAVGSMGIIISLAFIGYGYWAVILFFGPLLLARYSFKLYIDMRNLYISTIQALNKSMEAKDPYTSGHASRVEEYAVGLAEFHGLPFNTIEDIKTAAILHDIGKIGIDDSILNKASRLTQDEYAEIMKHPSIGAEIISNVDFLKKVTRMVKHHHERYDGGGYPDGLVGEEIPVEACILAIADAYDAMTSDRPYRDALTKEAALREIEKHAGTQFHPVLAEKFIELMTN